MPASRSSPSRTSSPVSPTTAIKRGAKVLKAPQDYDYGLHDFDVTDLDGDMIFFGMESQKAS
jgi:hypothetical protein